MKMLSVGSNHSRDKASKDLHVLTNEFSNSSFEQTESSIQVWTLTWWKKLLTQSENLLFTCLQFWSWSSEETVEKEKPNLWSWEWWKASDRQLKWVKLEFLKDLKLHRSTGIQVNCVHQQLNMEKILSSYVRTFSPSHLKSSWLRWNDNNLDEVRILHDRYRRALSLRMSEGYERCL